jgi:hypothetical protein
MCTKPYRPATEIIISTKEKEDICLEHPRKKEEEKEKN